MPPFSAVSLHRVSSEVSLPNPNVGIVARRRADHERQDDL